MLAIRTMNYSLATDLDMNHDADLNFKIESGYNSSVYPLHVIAAKGDVQMLNLVLGNSHLNLSVVNSTGVNAFWVASRFGHGEFMRRLAA